MRLFVTVALSGALGSLVHTISSFSGYVGNRALKRSWVWWVSFRTPRGIGTALLFYIVVRGGLIAVTGGTYEAVTGGTSEHSDPALRLNPYGLAALAALAGMFSDQATDKLRESFENMFRTREKDQRAVPLGQTMPVTIGTEPARLTVGRATELTVIGRNFNKACTASINGAQRKATWESDTRLTVTLLPEDVSAAGQLQVIVRNPAAAGGDSAPFAVTVIRRGGAPRSSAAGA